MPLGRITSINFDPETFPHSPYMEGFEAESYPEEILLVGYGPKDKFGVHEVAFNQDMIGFAEDVPTGEYSLHVKAQGTPTQQQVKFNLISNDTRESVKIFDFDYTKYLSEFESFYMATTQEFDPRITAEKIESELKWSVLYLQTIFTGFIDGNEAFWEKFYIAFDRVSNALNVKTLMHDEGINAPLRVVYGGPIDKAPNFDLPDRQP